MQIRKLQTMLEHIPYGMSISTYSILDSYLSYENAIKKNTNITFIDLLIYLNENGFTIIPDLDILHKSDEELFEELIGGIIRKKFEIRIRDEHLELILEKYQNIPGRDDVFQFCDRVSPLHFAVACNDHSFAKLLIDSNADVNMKTIFGCILESAIRYADQKMVELLLENGANIHKETFDPMKTAKELVNLKESKHSTLSILQFLCDPVRTAKNSFYLTKSKHCSQGILKLLQEAESCSFSELKIPIFDKINLGTNNHLPTDIVNIITSYDSRSLKKGYFKIPNENNDKKIQNENTVITHSFKPSV